MTKCIKPEILDTVLPQTQCGLCGYNGCMPYANAMVSENAPINLCTPGGVNTLNQLAELLDADATPYKNEMENKTKLPTVALIRENECIGCTKCIKACPVDAIIGGAKQMHTVLTDICTGCELCVPPCPIDCIDMLPASNLPDADISRQRFHKHTMRLSSTEYEHNSQNNQRKNYILSALERVKSKNHA